MYVYLIQLYRQLHRGLISQKWKTSVKGKLFVDGKFSKHHVMSIARLFNSAIEMCGYFREQFNKPDNMDQHKYKWTLPILTHIMCQY